MREFLHILTVQGVFSGDVPNSTYGVDDEVPGSIENDDDGVVVIPPSVSISSEQFEPLESAIDPTEDDNQHGMALYVRVREFRHSVTLNLR